jgi:hypothetical protein
MLTGTAVAIGGMYWFSRIGEPSNYASGLVGPALVTSAGPNMLSCRWPWPP